MRFYRRLINAGVLVGLILFGICASAQDISLLPKYGSAKKTESQLAVDRQFIAAIDERFKGDRKRASDEVATRGWQLLRQGQVNDAMRRFNQAWLLNNSNGAAVWGMAAIQASKEDQGNAALRLFDEAEMLSPNDIDLAVDHARAVGMVGVQTKNEKLVQNAMNRHANLLAKAPQHTLNLQNWAILNFYLENYAEAWKKIKLAEATPRGAELDRGFIQALGSKMQRP